MASPTPDGERTLMSKLRSANVPILADYRDLPSDAETEARSVQGSAIAVGQLSVFSKEPTTDSKSDAVDSEYEEGLRKEAERSFFQRNPRLVEQAKKIYGCVCQVCGFDFAKTYGVLGQDFAEVHHLNSLLKDHQKSGPKRFGRT
jgi:predicted HNH restriction endonuclease